MNEIDYETERTPWGSRDDLRDEILDVMEAPPTDDPIYILKRIAEILEAFDGNYAYFDGRGHWVLFPGVTS